MAMAVDALGGYDDAGAFALADDDPLLAADDADIDRELVARGGFAEFCKLAWPLVDTSALEWNWHHEAICEELEAVQRGETQELVINVPPASSKSTLVSVLYPAWVWTLDAPHRFIAGTYDLDLALRDARRHRKLVASEWYRDRWGVTLPTGNDESKAVSLFYNTAGGMRNSLTVLGGATGKHGDTHIVDDPTDTHAALQTSGKELQASVDWYDKTMSTRFRDPKRKARICIMQRLHDADLAAHIARKPGVRVLCLPMRFNPGHKYRYAKDPRTVPGELLHPARVPEEQVQELERALGDAAAAQLGQDPVPPGGSIFKEAWIQYWTELPPGGVMFISIDCTFKLTTDGSFVVIQAWLAVGPNYYLVDQRRERMDFPDMCDAIVAMSLAYPRAYKKLIEAKANGPAAVSSLKSKLSGLTEVEPDGGKESRANGVAPLWKSKNVFIPHPTEARYPDGRKGAPWVNTSPPGDPTPGGFVGEVTRFPKAATDDQVDTMTQALNHSAGSFAERFRRAAEAGMQKAPR